MPASPSTLGNLIKTKVDAKMAAIQGHSPLAQQNPSYFILMCTAIGTGIASGSPVINFTTTDDGKAGAPPVPGVGSGTGIVVDDAFFAQDLYTRSRGYVIADFGDTSHDPYPPGPDNSGQYLLAMCQGIAEAVKDHYATAWTLVSTHPDIYEGTGVINEGDFSGLSDGLVKSLIVAAAPLFIGPFWPRMAQAIAESYVETIHNHSTGEVEITGICVPSLSQVCEIGGSSGSGTGVAT